MANITIEGYDGGPLVLMPIEQDQDKSEGFVKEYWRPAMAILYLVLCFLDYAVRPIINEIDSKRFDLAETVAIIKNLDPTVQVQTLQIASTHEKWPPILSEFVHLAFGAILTGAAITRGMEKTARIKTNAAFGARPSGPKPPKTDNPDNPDLGDNEEF